MTRTLHGRSGAIPIVAVAVLAVVLVATVGTITVATYPRAQIYSDVPFL
jgi:hypothetical protein